MIKIGSLIQVIPDPNSVDPLDNTIGIVIGISSMPAWPYKVYKVLIEEEIQYLAENEMKVICS